MSCASTTAAAAAIFSIRSTILPVPPADSLLFSVAGSANNGFFGFFGDLNPFGLNYEKGRNSNNLLHQINVTDSLSRVVRNHQLKFGLDYRRLRPEIHAGQYALEYGFGTLPAVESNSVLAAFVISHSPNVQLINILHSKNRRKPAYSGILKHFPDPQGNLLPLVRHAYLQSDGIPGHFDDPSVGYSERINRAYLSSTPKISLRVRSGIIRNER